MAASGPLCLLPLGHRSTGNTCATPVLLKKKLGTDPPTFGYIDLPGNIILHPEKLTLGSRAFLGASPSAVFHFHLLVSSSLGDGSDQRVALSSKDSAKLLTCIPA